MKIEDYLYRIIPYYNKSPDFIRLGLGRIYRSIPMGIRYGKVYSDYKSLLGKSAYWSDEERHKYQLRQLKNTLDNAYKNTVFYKKIFDSVGFNPFKFNQIESIEKLPFIDKEDLRTNKKDIVAKNISRSKLLYVTTGGTSGIPVEVFYVKGRERSREIAFMTKQWERIGYRRNSKIARLRGTVVDHKGNNMLFKYEPVKNRLLLSTFDLYEENFPVFIKKLQEFSPDYIHTYPSAIVVLAKYILKKNIKFPSIKGLFCSSEQFYPGQREILEKAFNARVFSWYGHTEGTTLAGECEYSNHYHIFFEYGYTELIDNYGKVIREPNKTGEIVGTSFEMKGFPIIRYRTGDFAQYAGEKCKCGRNYTLIKNVEGRWLQEKIITNRNSLISLTSLNMHTDIFDRVIQYQFYQKEKGRVVLNLVRGIGFSDSDEKKIYKSLKEKLKDFVELDIQYVKKIDRTGRGKHKFLIQELDTKLYE